MKQRRTETDSASKFEHVRERSVGEMCKKVVGLPCERSPGDAISGRQMMVMMKAEAEVSGH